MVWSESLVWIQEPMTRCCVHANSLSGAIECEKFSGCVVNCRFSKRYRIVVSFLLCYLLTLLLTLLLTYFVTLLLIYFVTYSLCYLLCYFTAYLLCYLIFPSLLCYSIKPFKNYTFLVLMIWEYFLCSISILSDLKYGVSEAGCVSVFISCTLKVALVR